MSQISGKFFLLASDIGKKFAEKCEMPICRAIAGEHQAPPRFLVANELLEVLAHVLSDSVKHQVEFGIPAVKGVASALLDMQVPA